VHFKRYYNCTLLICTLLVYTGLQRKFTSHLARAQNHQNVWRKFMRHLAQAQNKQAGIIHQNVYVLHVRVATAIKSTMHYTTSKLHSTFVRKHSVVHILQSILKLFIEPNGTRWAARTRRLSRRLSIVAHKKGSFLCFATYYTGYIILLIHTGLQRKFMRHLAQAQNKQQV
jgi:hypothetical protein